MTRRNFKRIVIVILSGLIVWSCNHDRRGDLLDVTPSSMPHEGHTHHKSWISFNVKPDIANTQDVSKIKQNIILIATTVAQYEPVSIAVAKTDYKELSRLLGNLNTHHYPLKVIELEMNDLWMRDSGPTFVFNEKGQKAGINFNFNNEENENDLNSKATDAISTESGAKIIHSNLKLSNDCFEVDGVGTAIMTESCIINDELNPYWKKSEIEVELKLLLGLKKIIWLKGSEKQKTGNVYTNYYARFVKKGVVLVHRNNDSSSYEYELSRENIKILKEETDAQGDALEIVILDAPKNIDKNTDTFAAGYLGYYLCNRAVIMQSFGDEEADYRAYKILQFAFPERTVEQIQIDAISSLGGNVHRVIQQEPVL